MKLIELIFIYLLYLMDELLLNIFQYTYSGDSGPILTQHLKA